MTRPSGPPDATPSDRLPSTPSAPGTMRAIVYAPPSKEPLLRHVPRPRPDAALVHARTLLAGIDGTDEEILEGGHGEPPPGEQELVLGHECLGEVLDAPDGSGLEPGDRVLPLVRHGCAQCNPCLHGAADHCATGRYREHGIKQLHGFLREEWTHEPTGLVRVPPDMGEEAVLTEPLSIVVKALEEAERFQRRLPTFATGGGFQGGRALLAGTGSLGTLGAFLLRDVGMDVWAMDRTSDDAVGSKLLHRLGVTHLNSHEVDIQDVARDVGGFDLVIEATGAPKVVFDVAVTLRENGVMAMLGVPPEKEPFPVDGDEVMRRMVLRNQILFGSVNSNARHFEQALAHLGRFRRRWGGLLDEVITHRFPPESCVDAFRADDDPNHVKTVIDWR